MKTVEMIRFGKGYYVMTRENGRGKGREYYAKKGTAETRVKSLIREGYERI